MPARTVPAYGAPPERDTLLGGRYRLRAPIGSGGTADVFRGTDELLEREVAVKVFRAGTETITADGFCDEARTLARLSHRALVTVYDIGRHGQGAFMVTELIRGVTLRTRIDAGPLSTVQATRLGIEIASALDHVHAHGIIHHDVKPSNVLLGEDGSPYLADFGLSRAVDDRSHSSADTLVGTLAYMAPEQLLGQGASTASDVYALGLTLLEALTGHREYRGTPVEVGTAHLLHPPRIPDGLPDGLGRLLRAMTDQDPQARPDVDRVHLLLRELASPPPLRAAADRPVRRDAAPAAPAGAAGTDTATHRAPLPPALAACPAARSAGRRTKAAGKPVARRHAAVVGLAAAGVAGACALLAGGVPSAHDAPPSAAFRDRPTAPKEAEAAAAPQPAVPAPSTSAAPDRAAVLPASAPAPSPSAVPAAPANPVVPAFSYARQPAAESPATPAQTAKTRGSSGKAKGNSGKAKEDAGKVKGNSGKAKGNKGR
ncbi:serine/threonine-protein kinase [Streptomyces sp. cmx-4-9]|uniref:serine/threonine-protein kinase n=1 Tax=Streptomyces sp. cmx-4-9 TaxID=2790941 RepID=UPI0039812643